MSDTDKRELTKQLEVFQDYTASYGYPMSQEAHSRGLKLATERIQNLITQQCNQARTDELKEVKSCFANLQDDAEAVYIERNYVDYRIAELQAKETE